jgi:hypothetical protein
MIDWYILLLPIAVLGVVILFRFAGCSFTPPRGIGGYAGDVIADNPFVYYRLQETGGLPASAADAMNRKPGTYGVSPSPLNDPAHLSPQVLAPGIELGAPSIVPLLPTTTAVRFNGSDAFATGPLGNLSRFTVEAIVRPEWDLLNQRGFFYCVVESSLHVPGHGAPAPLKNAGFAVFAGPHDLNNPSGSPYCWQLWVGTGTEFHRAMPVESGPAPLVAAENTYLAVTFDDTRVLLHVFTPGEDLGFISHELVRPAYLPATHPEGTISLRIGMAGGSAALVPPFPGPPELLYPFVGRMAEVAIYDTVLSLDRIQSHIMLGFNT